ncbi:hypothetical protein V3C40_01165 [Janthinobacterium sp. LS2A]|uniref:hypothetical protein n=1 Tax=Janthinobacterium sp. LS2A TaxID=3118590 RepID=UPI002F93D913
MSTFTVTVRLAAMLLITPQLLGTERLPAMLLITYLTLGTDSAAVIMAAIDRFGPCVITAKPR